MTPQEYLDEKGIQYKISNDELMTNCVFNQCDQDSRTNEYHLYIHQETGQFQCKKCNETGNLITLARFFGDEIPAGKMSFSPSIKRTTSITKSTQNKFPPLTIEEVEKYHNTLPDRTRQYLIRRGITEHSIQAHKIGYGEFYGKKWITLPIRNSDGTYCFLKLRKDPDSPIESEKYMVYPRGEATIFGHEFLKEKPFEIFITEGEFDCLLLQQYGIPAISSTAGAGTFKDPWYELLEGTKKVYLCYDRDPAGQKATEEISRKLYEKIKDVEVFTIQFPQRMTSGKDLTDYFTQYGGNPDELMFELMKKVKNPLIPDRIATVPAPQRPVYFEEWKETIQSHFPDLFFPAEVSVSTLTQILITDITNPFALVLVDVPASGKTITLNFFSEIEHLTYVTDKFTPASFISNSANVKKEQLKDIDLLPRLRYKMFLIRDLATIFSKREDDLNECLGIMTRVLDGEGLCTDSGVHGQRHYTGDFLFMMLAASTPIPPKVWKMMGNLGSRLFFLNMNTREKGEDELVEQLQSAEYKKKEKECKQVTKQFLYTLWNQYKDGVTWDRKKENKEYLKKIVRCARLLAKLRGVINVWKDGFTPDGETEYGYATPVIEKPDRINQLFYNIARGHALASGRDTIDETDLKIVVELAIDSAPTMRTNLFKKLLENGGSVTTTQVEKLLNCSKPTARKEMECLKILGVVDEKSLLEGDLGNPEKIITIRTEFSWFLSRECKKIRGIPLTEEETLLDKVGL